MTWGTDILWGEALILPGSSNEQRPTGNSNFIGIKYRAAVFEHAVVTPIAVAKNHTEAVRQMMVNLQEYDKQAKIAAAQVNK